MVVFTHGPHFVCIVAGLLRVDPTHRLKVSEAAERLRCVLVDVHIQLPSDGRTGQSRTCTRTLPSTSELRADGFDRSLRMRCTVSVQMSSDSSVGALKMRLQTLSGGWCGVSTVRRVVRQPQHYPMRLALRSDSTSHTPQFTEISSARSSLGWLRILMRFAAFNRHQVCD